MNIDFVNQKWNSKIISLATIISLKTLKSMNPIFLSIAVMTLSLMSTVIIFKSSMTSWIAFVTILTFSSGMMTLFMYTASMSSNEKNKSSKNMKSILAILLISMMLPNVSQKSYVQTMKIFSSSMLMVVLASILILSMLALSIHGHHPNQTISTSF